MAHLEIFDSRGTVRRDFSDEEVSSLPVEQREDLFRMLSIYAEEVAAENALIEAEHALTDANRAQTKLHDERPKIDPEEIFLRELRAVRDRPKF